jgi:hypothetical protein
VVLVAKTAHKPETSNRLRPVLPGHGGHTFADFVTVSAPIRSQMASVHSSNPLLLRSSNGTVSYRAALVERTSREFGGWSRLKVAWTLPVSPRAIASRALARARQSRPSPLRAPSQLLSPHPLATARCSARSFPKIRKSLLSLDHLRARSKPVASRRSRWSRSHQTRADSMVVRLACPIGPAMSLSCCQLACGAVGGGGGGAGETRGGSGVLVGVRCSTPAASIAELGTLTMPSSLRSVT